MLQRLRYMTSDIHSVGLRYVLLKPTSVQRILSSMCVYALIVFIQKQSMQTSGRKYSFARNILLVNMMIYTNALLGKIPFQCISMQYRHTLVNDGMYLFSSVMHTIL